MFASLLVQTCPVRVRAIKIGNAALLSGLAIWILAGATQVRAAGVLPVRQCSDLAKLIFEGNTSIAKAELIADGSFTTPNGQAISNIPKEVPRLCRGGSSSLTFTAVVHR
jgi:hypothetical protein